MMTDLILAILHHILVFCLAALLAVELALVRPKLAASTLGRIVRIDGIYGLVAVLVIVVGIGRVLFGLKDWEYYVYYWAFWAKMAAFAAVALLSIAPTARFARWQQAAAGDPGYVVPDAEVASTRAHLHAAAAVFLLIPTFAAVMARGVGY